MHGEEERKSAKQPVSRSMRGQLMTTTEILNAAELHLEALEGHVFDFIDLAKPGPQVSLPNLSRMISKATPLLANQIEFRCVELLNEKRESGALGEWIRQDPGFPDAVFQGAVRPRPGIEIKAWFPLATEIAARFRESQVLLADQNTRIALLAWLPEHLLYGRPVIVGVSVLSALSVARARDNHYHNPPSYVVIEPEDTTSRTRNLQQTNVNGFRWQGSPQELEEARAVVRGWGTGAVRYRPVPEYQAKLKELMAEYNYRGDTNFAKMDRVCHEGLEEFKSSILDLPFRGLPIKDWSRMLSKRDDAAVREAFRTHIDVPVATAAEVVDPPE